MEPVEQQTEVVPAVVVTPVQETKFTFTKANVESLLKGLLIAVVGAALTYTTKIITNTDFGVYTPLLVAFFGVVANAVRLWISE